MSYCGNCGAFLEDGERFCGNCGADQMAESPMPGSLHDARDMVYSQGGYVAPAAKKGNEKKLILLVAIIAAVAVTVILVICAALGGGGVPKSPRDRFIYYMGEFSETLFDETKELGGEVIASILFPLNTADASNTNTTVAETKLDLGDLTDQDITITQESAYDKKTGDTSYEFSYSNGGDSLGTGGIYFVGNEMLIKPMDSERPMIRYEMDEKQAKGLKDTSATERFALVLQGRESSAGEDWKLAAEDFVYEYLPDLTDDDVFVDNDKGELLGDFVDWEALTITSTGSDAVELLDGFLEYYGPLIGVGRDNIPNLTEGLSKKEKKKAEIEVSICAYQNQPAAIWMAASLGEGKELEMELICYHEGEEKEVSVNASMSGAEVLSLLDTILADGDEYTYESKLGFGDNSLGVKKTGELYSDAVDLSGKYTIGGNASIEGKSKTTGEYSKAERVTERSNSFTFLGLDGAFNTDIDEVIGESGIDAPKFVKKSGVDTDGKLKKLKEALGGDIPEVLYETNNESLHTLAVISLLSGKGASSAGSLLGGML